VHVPLVVKYPNKVRGGVVNSLVSEVDLLPTVLQVVGVVPPPGIEGRSLREAESGQRWVVAEATNVPTNKGDLRGEEPDEVALFFGSLKRVLKRDGSAETYDLSVDPGETKNRDPEIHLPEEWIVEYMRYLQTNVGGLPPKLVTDPEVIRRLRSLGYVR
jgi:arylsulfatase A-like enzyme